MYKTLRQYSHFMYKYNEILIHKHYCRFYRVEIVNELKTIRLFDRSQ